MLADIQVLSPQDIWFELISFGIIIMCARSNSRMIWIAKDVPVAGVPRHEHPLLLRHLRCLLHFNLVFKVDFSRSRSPNFKYKYKYKYNAIA